MNAENELLQDIPNVLIVDDIPLNLKILGEILKRQGYKIRPVPSGILALLVAEKEKPDLILLDIMMPDMDGYEVCRRLKENPNLKDIPVIFISALNETKDIVKALQAGAVDFITKPFQAEEVIARVSTHLQLYQQSKKLQEQSKELKALIATKDKFFSIIAHDLRGPLGGFLTLTELLTDESLEISQEQQKELTADLNHSAKNIFRLLENLLEWARMQQGQTNFQPKNINLLELVNESIKPLLDATRNKELDILIAIPADQTVFADSNMMQSVIRNLISNAIKFTAKGGKVEISSGFTENRSTVVVVKDSGIGMDQVIKSNLFKINVNNSRSGTDGELSSGLGLHLCKEFVEKHNGEIWVESEEHKGSSFFFTIPQNMDPLEFSIEKPDQIPEKMVEQLENLKILIAEDNENSEVFMRIVTSSFSNRVLVASTGTEAVELAKAIPDIDLILMDVKMPEMDGYEATRQIRTFNKEVIIIAQTAFGMMGEREKAIAAGCNDYISKPIETAALLDLIKKYFKK